MKKLIPFLFLFCSVLSFSQKTYDFNFLTKFKTSLIDHQKSSRTTDAITYFDIDNFSYFLKVSKANNQYYAKIIDFENNLFHSFKIIEHKKGSEIYFSFVYESSREFKQNLSKNVWSNFTEITTDGKEKHTLLQIFQNKKSKKSLDFQLTLQTSNVPLFSIFKLSFLHPFEGVKGIDMKENFIVTKAVRDDGCFYTLVEYKNVDFVVTVPKVLNYSKF